MSNLTQEATELVVREAPEIISVTQATWQKLRPELKKLMSDVTPSSDGKMIIKLDGSEQADSLQKMLEGPAIDAEWRPGGMSSPGAAAAGATPPPPPTPPPPGATPPGADVPWNKPAQPLANVLKAGAATALVGGAGYAAMQSGAGPQEQAAKGPPPGTVLGGGSTPSSDVQATKPADTGKPREIKEVKPHYVPPNTAELEARLTQVNTEMAGIKNTEWTQQDEDKWNTQIDDLRTVADAAEKRNMWAEAAERIGQALTQLFAAKKGLETGVDMSGLKFDKTDWSKKTDQILDRLKADTGIKQEQKRGARETVKTARDALERLRGDSHKLTGDIARMKQDASRHNADAGQKADEANQRNQMDLWEMESREDTAEKKQAGDLRRAMLTKMSEEFKKDAKKSAAFKKVIGFIQVANSPDSLADKDMERALQTWINNGLGDETAFERLLPDIDTWSPEAASTHRQRWGEQLSKEAGITLEPDEKKEVRRQINPGTGQTKIIYSDGSFEIIEPAKK